MTSRQHVSSSLLEGSYEWMILNLTDTTVLWKHVNYCISCFYNIKFLPFIVKFFNSIKEYVKSPDSAGTELHSHT